MVLGNTMAGKTSFVQSLLCEKCRLTGEQDRTNVVEKHKWRKESKEQPESRLDIQIFDFGGHECYFITNIIFWTENALFLILFNLEIYEEATHQELVGQWIDSITERIHMPRIMFIGSHKDKVRSEEVAKKMQVLLMVVTTDEKRKVDQIKDELNGATEENGEKRDQLRVLLCNRPAFLAAAALSSATLDGMKATENEILDILADTNIIPIKEIPLTWHDLRDSLTNESGKLPWITLEHAERLDKAIQKEYVEYAYNLKYHFGDVSEAYLEDIKFLWPGEQQFEERERESDDAHETTQKSIDQFRDALGYLRSCGDIIWLEDSKLLSRKVCHRPDKLIDIFKLVFCYDLRTQIVNCDPRFAHFPESVLEKMKTDLDKNTRISKQLLRCIWKNILPADETSSQDSFEVLVELMVRFEMAYLLPRQSNSIDMSVCEDLRVPWFLPVVKPSLPWDNRISDNTAQVTIKIKFLWRCPQLLLPTLCVSLQRYFNDSIEWKTGIYAIAARSENIKLLLELTEAGQSMHDNDVLAFSFRGDGPSSIWFVALPVLQDTEQVLQQWPGVVYSSVILAPCCLTNEREIPTEFPFSPRHGPSFDCQLMCTHCKKKVLYPPQKVLVACQAQLKKEEMNFLRYSILVQKVGAQKILQILKKHIEDVYGISLHDWLRNEEDIFRERLGGQLKWIRRCLYPESERMQETDLDISVLKTIITKLADDFPKPRNGWQENPDMDDFSQAADILRLGRLRNGPLLAHNPRCQLNQHEFHDLWQEAETILLRLDPNCEAELHMLKSKPAPIS